MAPPVLRRYEPSVVIRPEMTEPTPIPGEIEMRQWLDDIDRIAHDEAGHAVVAHFLGRKIVRATIEPHDGLLGVVEIEPLPPDEAVNGPVGHADFKTRAVVELDIMVKVAGPVAESIYTGAGLWSTKQGQGERDEAYSMIAFVMDDDGPVGAYLDDLAWRARELLELLLPAVEAVALALVDRTTLSAADVAEIYKNAMGT